MKPNYSIIIPHKNIPDLLQRCLDSIPVRDDVEVIVVDDNSDPREVDFEHFPEWNGKHYQYFLTKEGKGAGYARNVGLDHAQGRWIVFADADDFFTKDFDTLLDEMVDAEEDVVFFDYINVLSDDITQQLKERVWYRTLITAHLKNIDKSEDWMRCYFCVPWCKLVKKELIEPYRIRFSEVQWGNDVYFSAQVGCRAQTIRVSDKIGYVLTSRKGSLTDHKFKTPKEYRIRLTEAMKCDCLFRQFGYVLDNQKSNVVIRESYQKRGLWKSAWFCIANVSYPLVFSVTALFWMRRMKEKCFTKNLEQTEGESSENISQKNET